MTELIITSSVLILVVIVLRHFLKGKISLRLQYALWALVLVRLLVPVALFESPFSVMNAVQAARYAREVSAASAPAPTLSSAYGDTGAEDAALPGGAGQNVTDSVTNEYHHVFRWGLWAQWVWYIGIGIVGMTLLLSNLSFGRKLRKTRKAYQADDCKLPVYTVDALQSPCLFGLFHPSIYITSEVAGDETKLRHVLAHELTHYRHGDHIWAALRGLCLAVHWYNPLVWLAAALSRRDSELACDEGTIKRIGEEGRMEYGRTLIGLTCEKRKAMDLLCCATTMTDGKNGIKERIALIAKKPKLLIPAVIAVVLVAAVAVGCTFTGATGRVSERPVTLYDCAGLTVAIPNEYMDQLVVMAEPEPEAAEQGLLISVYEKQSYEECRADYGEDAYAGFLFAIVRYTQAQYEQFLCSDGSGQSFFARDDTWYYGWFVATDVQFYRTDMGSLDADSDEWKAWEALCEGCASVRDDFTARNHLTAYSDSEFFNKEFTYDGAHRYVTYYPYYIHQDIAAAQGFRWQDAMWTLVLSQPATQGNTGIWCVERWYDENGNVYPYFPDADGTPASEHYAGEQAQCDAGHKVSALDPAQVALTFIRQYFGHADVTLECIAVGDAPPADEEPIASADVNKDGRDDAFYLDKTQMDSGRCVTLRIYNDRGYEIWNEDANQSHAGWNSLFLCTLDGESYLLRYRPEMYQGYCTYTYTLFTLEGGAETVYQTNTLEFDINGTKALDTSGMVAFADEVNALLEKSILLLSSEGGTFSFGPASSGPFLERYAWLDDNPGLYDEDDGLETRLAKYSAWAVDNRAQSGVAG